MGNAARLGDPTAHGGSIVVGFPMVLIGGMPAARVGDMHVCPMLNPGVPPPPHVGGPIAMGSPMVLIGGMPAARMGDMVTCAGPPGYNNDGMPYCMIGEGGSGSASGGGAGSSAASSASASAKTALSDNVEATTKEKHWIELEFVDKAGNPVSGVPYKFNDPDKNESEGTLKLDGRILRDAVSKGKGEVVLYKLFNAKWSKEIVKFGDKVKLSAEAEGFEDGTKVNIQIYRKEINSPDIVVKSLDEKISGNKIEIELENKFESEDEDKKHPLGCYYFEAICGMCLARSALLFKEDFIELELKDSDGNSKSNEEFILYLPNGKVIQDKLDSNGYKKVEKIPAGEYSVKFPNLNKKDKS